MILGVENPRASPLCTYQTMVRLIVASLKYCVAKITQHFNFNIGHRTLFSCDKMTQDVGGNDSEDHLIGKQLGKKHTLGPFAI